MSAHPAGTSRGPLVDLHSRLRADADREVELALRAAVLMAAPERLTRSARAERLGVALGELERAETRLFRVLEIEAGQHSPATHSRPPRGRTRGGDCRAR